MTRIWPFALWLLAACADSPAVKPANAAPAAVQPVALPKNNASVRTVHVFVALCDNRYQGIVPVPNAIGNGQDADNNLYWGCDNGLRTFFKKKNSDWTLHKTQKKPDSLVLERLLFKHKTQNVYLLADAYDGRFIKQTTVDFLAAAAGKAAATVLYQNDSLYFGGAANLLAYIGHDGLMDFKLPVAEQSASPAKRETIVLACYSRHFFAPHLKAAGAAPLLWTTNLMAPEAYTLHDALRPWIKGEPAEEIRNAAAQAYSRYQHCSFKAAKNLLVWGW